MLFAELLNPMTVITATLLFVRISAMMFAMPIFGESSTPILVRILTSVAITICLLPILPMKMSPTIIERVEWFTLIVVKEVIVGVGFGFLARMTFDGFVMASSFVGFQMGFGTASIFVPDAEQNMESFTALHRFLILLLFLGLNLHHVFFKGVFELCELIPLGKAGLKATQGPLFIEATSAIFSIAIQLSAPILVALLFATTALGLIARAVPQVNVFIVSFPVNFAVGLSVYIATLPFMPGSINQMFGENVERLKTFVQSLAIQ